MTFSRLLAFGAAVASSLVCAAAAEAPLLDSLLRFPGDYSQICDARPTPFPAPIPGFRAIMHGEAGFSEAKLALMKERRAVLIPAIAAKLEGIDLTKKPAPQPRDPAIPKNEIDVEPVGADPTVFSTLLLTMIEQLDATEVFPQLMSLEEKYHTLLIAAEKDPSGLLPQFDGAEGAGVIASNLLKEGEDYDTLTPVRKTEVERQSAVFEAQALQRDILAVLVRAMRKQGFKPMLASSLEKTYGRLLKEKWGAHEDFSKYKSAAEIPKEERESVKFDPVHRVAYQIGDPVSIPYSEAIRDLILELTRQFLANGKK